ncbi:MAG: magnesium transporter [Firmicutes bacterium]|nr:magnesium transporter [Bacillota bacterium]
MLEQTLDLDALIATVNNLLDAAGDDSSTQKTVLLEYLNELQPFDLANVLSRLEFSKQLAFLSILPVDTAAEVLSHLEFEHQYRLLDHADEQVARAILAQMASDSLVDLLGAIHPLQANEILKRLPPEDLDHIRQMMTYPPESAGGLMTVSYLSVRATWTAEQVIAHFRKVGQTVEEAGYVYVIDQYGRLVGVASMREVILAHPTTPISEIMVTKAISIPVDADQEEAARLLSQYDFTSLPVTDRAGRMVGIITADDILDVVEEEATEDIQRLGGTSPFDSHYLRAPLTELYSKRIGWLLVLLITGYLTGTIMSRFENLLNEVIMLAFFIPLLIDAGGNAGSQASTLVIRAMALGEVESRDFLRVIWREARVGILLGATLGLFAYARALLLGTPADLGLTVAISLCAIVLISSTIGAILPIIGQRIGLDPAVFSSPLITTISDAVGLLIYFEAARLIMGLS